jgi:hypothetical protein
MPDTTSCQLGEQAIHSRTFNHQVKDVDNSIEEEMEMGSPCQNP